MKTVEENRLTKKKNGRKGRGIRRFYMCCNNHTNAGTIGFRCQTHMLSLLLQILLLQVFSNSWNRNKIFHALEKSDQGLIDVCQVLPKSMPNARAKELLPCFICGICIWGILLLSQSVDKTCFASVCKQIEYNAWIFVSTKLLVHVQVQ